MWPIRLIPYEQEVSDVSLQEQKKTIEKSFLDTNLRTLNGEMQRRDIDQVVVMIDNRDPDNGRKNRVAHVSGNYTAYDKLSDPVVVVRHDDVAVDGACIQVQKLPFTQAAQEVARQYLSHNFRDNPELLPQAHGSVTFESHKSDDEDGSDTVHLPCDVDIISFPND